MRIGLSRQITIMTVTLLAACSTGTEPNQPFGDNSEVSNDDEAVADDYGDEASANGEDGDGDPGDDDGGDDEGDDGEMAENAYCLPVADWDPDWVAYADEVVAYINTIRAEGHDCGGLGLLPPAPALELNPALICASRVHSGDMAERDYFDHETPEGKDPAWRLEQAGFTGHLWAENIGAGYPVATKLVDGWLESEVHCGNMLDPNYSVIGVGYAFGPTAAYAHYWTLTLGN